VLLVLGAPDAVAATGTLGSTGVDELVAAVLHHPNGGLGVVKAAVRAGLSCRARISCEEGWIDLPAFMHCPTHLTVRRTGADARLESPVMPLDESIQLASTMDAILTQVGVAYPVA
jgi:hypothetical protein